jgi:hypothetical protein
VKTYVTTEPRIGHYLMSVILSFANLITLDWNGNTQGIILPVWKQFRYSGGCRGTVLASDPPVWTQLCRIHLKVNTELPQSNEGADKLLLEHLVLLSVHHFLIRNPNPMFSFSSCQCICGLYILSVLLSYEIPCTTVWPLPLQKYSFNLNTELSWFLIVK